MNASDTGGRPELAVSAAIFRNGKVLLARRAREPALGLFTLPGGRVEHGERLADAVLREVREETALTIELVGTAGYHEAIGRDGKGNARRHFVIVAFAARWIAGEPVLDAEHSEFRWVEPGRIGDLATTAGLAGIVTQAMRLIRGEAF
jgi:ADP-ribose pyrophosphatase YjhB (NUDIX family)